jgi:hypothetical protein
MSENKLTVCFLEKRVILIFGILAKSTSFIPEQLGVTSFSRDKGLNIVFDVMFLLAPFTQGSDGQFAWPSRSAVGEGHLHGWFYKK